MKTLEPQSNPAALYVESPMIMTSAPPPLTAEIADLKRQTHTLLYISGVNLIFNALTIFVAVMAVA